MAVVGFKLSEMKKLFVDRKEVIDAVDKSSLKVLSRFGAFVRTTSRQSIKNAPKPVKESDQKKRGRKRKQRPRVSAPGNPPLSHTGLLKRNIFFGVDPQKKSVVIGPVKLNKPGFAMQALEEGGRSIGSKGQRINIAARPFMKPAFDKELTKAPQMWRDAVK